MKPILKSKKKPMKVKKLPKELYVETYCKDRRVRFRKPLYVSEDVHEKIIKIAQLFHETHVSAISLVTQILEKHIEDNMELFREMEAERREKARELLGF